MRKRMKDRQVGNEKENVNKPAAAKVGLERSGSK